MIRFRPKLGDINEILAGIVDISHQQELFEYLAVRSFEGDQLSFTELEEHVLMAARRRNADHWETHVVMLDDKIVGYSDGVLQKELIC